MEKETKDTIFKGIHEFALGDVDYIDTNENGVYDSDEDEFISSYDGIISGQPNDVDFMSGVFQSFSDAPGGFSEELKEFTWALGA